jgi:hypothetical protein
MVMYWIHIHFDMMHLLVIVAYHMQISTVGQRGRQPIVPYSDEASLDD